MSNPDEIQMPLWQHLDELRKRLIRISTVLLFVSCFTYYYSEPIVLFLQQPILDILPEGEKHLYFTGITDKFFVYLKISMLAAVVVTAPYLLWEIWGFVSPALYRRERKFFVPFIFLGSLTFVLGLAFAFYVMIPFGYEFLVNFGSPNDRAIITLTDYFDLTLKMMLAMGVVFELPVILMLLAKFGIVNAEMLRKYRRQAFVANAVISAIATPSPDAFTMVLMMVPLLLLYEGSIIGVVWVQKQAVSADK